MPYGRVPKYEPLRRYLLALPSEVTTVTLTLAEITAIIGGPLPATARLRPWWGNHPRASHSRAWLDAGWRVTGRDVRSALPTVTFTRAASTPELSAPSRRRTPQAGPERRRSGTPIGDG
jgi:hypothetical protein